MANKIETISKNFKPRINLNHNIYINYDINHNNLERLKEECSIVKRLERDYKEHNRINK